MGSENLVYVFAAYTAIWLISFGYLYSIGSRQKRMQRELETLEKQLAQQDHLADEERVAAG